MKGIYFTLPASKRKHLLLLILILMIARISHGQDDDRDILYACMDELNSSPQFIEMKWTIDYRDTAKTNIYKNDRGHYAIHNKEAAMLWYAKIMQDSKDAVSVTFGHEGEATRYFTLINTENNWLVREHLIFKSWLGFSKEPIEEWFDESDKHRRGMEQK